MSEEADEDRHEVEAELSSDDAEVLHLQDLAADQEEDAHGGHVDHPGGDGHHGLRQADEEVQQRLAALLHHGERDPEEDRKEDQSEDVRAVGELTPDLPRVEVRRIAEVSAMILFRNLSRVCQHCPVLLYRRLKVTKQTNNFLYDFTEKIRIRFIPGLSSVDRDFSPDPGGCRRL